MSTNADDRVIQVTGSMLKAGRVWVGLSQEQVAQRAHVTRPALTIWERSSDSVPRATYPALARVIDVLETAGVRFRHDGVFVERATPLNRTVIHSEATA
jgi:transcriptional regulator with XRE-family HTH domain